MEAKLKDERWLNSLDVAMLKVVGEGRAAGGANPPESFQLFVNGYVPFWNEVDPGCDHISWEMIRSTGKRNLTRDVRKRMNDIVREFNFQLARSAYRLAHAGVIYLEDWQKNYEGHQLCEPGPDERLKSPIDKDTWFWVLDRFVSMLREPKTPS